MDLHALTLTVPTLHQMRMEICMVSRCRFRYFRLSVTLVFVSLSTFCGDRHGFQNKLHLKQCDYCGSGFWEIGYGKAGRRQQVRCLALTTLIANRLTSVQRNYIIQFDSIQVVYVQTKDLTELHLVRKGTGALFEESIFCIMLLNGTLNQLLCQKKASHYTCYKKL